MVRDIEESVRFYSEILGMRIAGRTERHGEFVEQVLAFPNAHIKGGFVDMGEGHQLELIQYLSPHSGPNTVERNDLGAAHLAFFVEDLDTFYSDTREKGLRYNNPPASMFDENGKPIPQGLLRPRPRRQLARVRRAVLRECPKIRSSPPSLPSPSRGKELGSRPAKNKSPLPQGEG